MNASLFPKVSQTFPELDSTNAEALRRIHAGGLPEHGSVLVARSQVQGKGQGSNGWFSSAGANLTLSLVLHPEHVPPSRVFALSQFTALAVARTVARHLPSETAARVRVKWPNDIYVGSQKIAGILIHNGLRAGRLHWSVVGIGLNVNETAFPPALRNIATSLALLTKPGHGPGSPPGELPPPPPAPRKDRARSVSLQDRAYPISLPQIQATLFHHLSTLYPYTTPAALPELDRLYHRLLYQKNQPARYAPTDGRPPFTARIISVDAAGHLLLESVAGDVTAWALRDIRYVR